MAARSIKVIQAAQRVKAGQSRTRRTTPRGPRIGQPPILQAGADKLLQPPRRLHTVCDRTSPVWSPVETDSGLDPCSRTCLAHRQPPDRRGVRHGVNFRAGEPGDPGGQRLGQHPGRLHPRPVAAAGQLGQLGGLLRAGRLRAADAGLARRSGNGRTGPGEPGRPSREDLEAGRRPHHRDHHCPGQQTRGHGALDRGLAGADARGPGPVGGHGGDRPRSLPRRAAPAGLGAQGGRPVPGQPAARAAARSRSRSASSRTAGRTRWRRRRPRSSTTRSTSPAPGSLSSRWATPTSTRGPRRR